MATGSWRERGRTCRFFNMPRGCRFGDQCRFSHVPNDRLVHTTRPSQSDPFDLWLAQTPESVPFLPIQHRLSSWITTAYSFVTGTEEDHRQRVIDRLSLEGGLSRIKEIFEAAPSQDDTAPAMVQQWSTSLALPLLKTLSHHEVTKSLILERPLDNIHNFLYGTGGARGVALFGRISLALTALPENDHLLDDLNPTLTVLRRMIDLNGAAKVNEALLPPVSAFQELLSREDMKQAKAANCQRILQHILKAMGQGLSMPLPSATAAHISDNIATFEIGADLPGRLREGGPRHNNDHEDISDIEILPTKDEVESQLAEYLPVHNPRQLHLPGLEGLLDRHFRLLREDTVGQLRDAVRYQVQELRRSHGSHALVTREQKGSRVMTYRDLCFEKILPGRDYISIQISFQQPSSLATKTKTERKAWWESSRSLQHDALVCIISPSGFVSFMSICSRVRKQGKDQGYDSGYFDDAHRATTCVRLIEPYEFSIGAAESCFKMQEKHVMTVCEFPGVLLPAFWHTLEALKMISRNPDMPFADLVAPTSTADADELRNRAPQYAMAPNFSFDLGSLINGHDTLQLTVDRRFDYTLLQKHSTLDDAQQIALVDGLTHRLALIQGPPGTGKSYLGVTMIRVLLENKDKATLGPIICVCYTNHALDQLLEHLVEAQVRQIVRIGGQSKSEVLQNVNLKTVVERVAETATERRRRGQLHGTLDELSKSIKHALKDYEEAESPNAIYSFLQGSNERHYQELEALSQNQVDDQGFQLVDYDDRPPLVKWLDPRPASQMDPAWQASPPSRSVDELQSISLLSMVGRERALLHKYWQEQIRARKGELLRDLFTQYRRSRQSQRNCFRERDLRCLRQANVIGLTTSGLAKNLDLLRRVGSKVLLCEEAGEVLEAHMLTAFLPSIEHAILIGDHQQLRPQIQNYELQSTNRRGTRYSLDVSLFERLIDPPFAFMPKLTYSSLEIQRRMHPSISALIRRTLYPKLQDHPSVAEHPAVAGMAERLFWFDHRKPEEPHDHTGSRTNLFEVEMVAAIVSHLVRQCQYRTEDIAVLTPYLGQLRKLKNKLRSMFEIVVDDRDETQLQQAGLHNDGETVGNSKFARSTLLKALRLATVDNFQGDEAKVVVVSLVRSNEEKNCGFLRTTNRANVLLSRAQHGMYLIGDSSCYEPQEMWRTVIEMLHTEAKISERLPLQCSRHPNTPILVAGPDDFVRFSPEGGCNQKCADRLECGHQCPNKCHAKTLHEQVRCPEPCLKPFAGCDHLCQKACGDACGRCQMPIEDVLLPCGHVSASQPCYIARDPRLAECHVLVDREMPGCLHCVEMKCFEIITDSTPCTAQCGEILRCQHQCAKRCHHCQKRQNGIIVSVHHGECQKPCETKYSTCGHHCKAPCHRDRIECCPCQAQCQTQCIHSRCGKACHEPCAPCAEPCQAGCEHSGVCNLPCAVPCDILPCARRCQMTLHCGHQCPSVCGELCPSERLCQSCCTDDIRQQLVDYTEMITYGEVNLDEDPCLILGCGHILTMSSLDGMMEFSEHYNVDQDGVVISAKTSQPFHAKNGQCAECRHPIRNIQRYNRIWRRALLDESTKKFIAWSTAAFVPLSEGLDKAEAILDNRSDASMWPAVPSSDPADTQRDIQLSGALDSIVRALEKVQPLAHRHSDILRLRKKIQSYLHKVTEGEQPFGRICDMLQSHRIQEGRDRFDDTSQAVQDNTILQSKQRIMATSLSLRCDVAILTDFFELRRLHHTSFTTKYDWRAVDVIFDFADAYNACLDLATEAETRAYPMVQVEAILYFARLAALERSNLSANDPEKITNFEDTLNQAGDLLIRARNQCDVHPGTTPGMTKEIDAAEKMLREDTFYEPVSNEEKRQIIQAMKKEFQVNGHWFYCPNGHPFTIGECGGAMQTARCPECGEMIGGAGHQLAAGNRAAHDITTGLEGMTV